MADGAQHINAPPAAYQHTILHMRFAVPQFIEVEDKVFGPLTVKQAIYVAGGAGVTLAVLTRWGFFLAILVGLPIGILTFALAFTKVNNRPFSNILYAASFYTMRNKLYLWKKVIKKDTASTASAVHGLRSQRQAAQDQPLAPKMSQSHLKELAWSLDTRESLYANEEQWK